MSSEPQAQPTAPWPVLDLNERRVLGVLVEKAKTTPDVYPMSLNSLVSGCNQKSNRDPVLDLTEADVEDALARCQKKGLTIRLTGGGRVERWKHNLYDAWTQHKVELAVVAELLLRGPQTEGELRGRASRMDPIDDLDALRVLLKPMVQRGLIVYLTAEDRRGAMLTHGFHDANELARLRSRAAAEPLAPASPAAVTSRSAERLSAPANELAAMKQQIAELQAAVQTLQHEVHSLRQSLGG